MIKIKSPTRVDLSGGTLDCWPLSVFVPQAVTVNLAIDIQTGVELEPLDTPQIQIQIANLNFDEKFADLEQFLANKNDQIKLIYQVIHYFSPALLGKNGFRLKTTSDSPIGGGLGGSSSLCISLIKAFFQLLNLNMTTEKVVELAHNIEARVLHTPTGTQDYVPAWLGGLSVIRYFDSGMQVESLPFSADEVNKKLGLVYTGKPHHSGINNWQVIKKAVEKDPQTLKCLNDIANISMQIAEICKAQSWKDLPELLNLECDARIALSSVFTSPEIEDLRNTAFDLGAEASKICGAGGGGCVLVWADPEVHAKLSVLCQEKNYQHLKVKAVPKSESLVAEKQL